MTRAELGSFGPGIHMTAWRFMPGQWQLFTMTESHKFDRFCIHASAPEPVIAEFQVILDGVIQDYTLTVDVERTFAHSIAIGDCDSPKFITLRRKATDDDRPVFVIAVDGSPPQS